MSLKVTRSEEGILLKVKELNLKYQEKRLFFSHERAEEDNPPEDIHAHPPRIHLFLLKDGDLMPECCALGSPGGGDIENGMLYGNEIGEAYSAGNASVFRSSLNSQPYTPKVKAQRMGDRKS